MIDELYSKPAAGRPPDLAGYLVITTDAHGVIATFDSAAERTLGYTSEECIGRLTTLVIRDPTEILQRAAALSAELESQIPAGFETLAALPRRGIGERSLWTFVRKDRSRFAALVTTTPLKNGKGDFIGLRECVRDISDGTYPDLALRERDGDSHDLHAEIPAMYFAVDQSGTIRSVNGFAANQLRYSEEQLVGRPVFGLLPPPEGLDVRRRLAECIANPGEVHSWESRLLCSDGGLLDVRQRARAVPGHRGALTVLIASEDISERRTLQSQLAESHKMEAIGRLAGGIAHDFNNILTAIRGFAELHLQEHPPGDPGREDVLQIESAAERASQLTQGLLAFSRRANVHPTPLDLRVVASDAAGLLRRLVGEHIALWLDIEDEVPCVLADRVQIDQVLLNLAANARDAMPAGGQLCIHVTASKLARAFVKSHPGSHAGRHVILEVSDTGVGMDDATKAHLFEPLFTTKPVGQGTGLGLASVYGIVKQAHGYIEVESRPGGGSAFRIYLPAIEDRALAPSRETFAKRTHGHGTETVLVVEDDPGVRSFARRVLQAHGYKVVAFAEPGVALQAASEDPTCFDALVTDIVMPNMSGPALAQKMTRFRPDLPVLFISGYEAGSLLAGAPTPLAKPFAAEDLAAAVGAMFGRSNQAEKPSGHNGPSWSL